MKKVVIFDFDGTIADSSSFAYEIYSDLMHHLSRPILSKDAFEQMKTRPLKERIRSAGIPLYKIGRLVRLTKQLQREHALKTIPYPGITEMLTELSESYMLAIVSSNNPDHIRVFLDRNKINHFSVVSGNHGIHGKARALRQLLRRLAMTPENALYIGDETRDIVAARHAGIPIISVNWGFDHEDLLESMNPGQVTSSIAELRQMIQSHLGQK